MLNILFAASAADWQDYKDLLPCEFEKHGLPVHLFTETITPEAVDYIIYAPSSPLQDFAPYISLKAVLSLWAGVEGIVKNKTLTQPLCRLVDPGLAQGMREWVVGHVLRYHLGMDTHVLKQDGIWRADSVAPLATERRVGILGLGELGQSCGSALTALGFHVSGWARGPKSVAGINCYHGTDGLKETLQSSEILILLLPLTAETKHIMHDKTFAMLPNSAFLINAGRGALIDETALLQALGSSQIAHATLDVFETEPLPKQHPFWQHRNVTVTPHIASATRPRTAAATIVDNIARAEAGKPLLHLVDPARGY